jgi:Family of unknown function (DUF5681)
MFKKGASGNPAGRPPGARHKTTLAVEALLDGEGEALTRKAIEMAMAGDIIALRVCLDRILPPRKDRPISFALPPINNAGEASRASAAVLAAVGAGVITPGEGAELSRIVEGYIKTLEATEFERRLQRLEGKSVTIVP